MQLFYTKNIQNNIAIIEGQENIHLSKVLRKVVGDEVHILNGIGQLYLAEITQQTKKATTLIIKQTIENKSKNSNNLILAVAPTKNMDRFEWMVEKATEIGVKEIIPFFSQNSERRRLKTERVEAIAISAIKQSKTLFVPKIWEPIKFKELFNKDMTAFNDLVKAIDECSSFLLVFPPSKLTQQSRDDCFNKFIV